MPYAPSPSQTNPPPLLPPLPVPGIAVFFHPRIHSSIHPVLDSLPHQQPSPYIFSFFASWRLCARPVFSLFSVPLNPLAYFVPFCGQYFFLLFASLRLCARPVLFLHTAKQMDIKMNVFDRKEQKCPLKLFFFCDRIDVFGIMLGLDAFPHLWKHRQESGSLF